MDQNLTITPAAEAGALEVTSGWMESAASGALEGTEAGALAAVVREEAELKAAVVLARRFPRAEAQAYARIIQSCQRPRFAEGALYSFPRGSARVEGPSVDLAREEARCWGNIRYGLRIVSVDEKQIHIRGYAMDLETNNYVEMEDRFARLIQRRDKGTGRSVWLEPDERDLRELVNRRGAILVRNALLQVLPPDVTEDAMAAARDTIRKAAQGEIHQSREEATRRLVLAFDELRVTTEMLAGYLGHSVELVTADGIADLRKIYKSIHDGQSRREEYFQVGGPSGPEGGARRPASIQERIRGTNAGAGNGSSAEMVSTPSPAAQDVPAATQARSMVAGDSQGLQELKARVDVAMPPATRPGPDRPGPEPAAPIGARRALPEILEELVRETTEWMTLGQLKKVLVTRGWDQPMGLEDAREELYEGMGMLRDRGLVRAQGERRSRTYQFGAIISEATPGPDDGSKTPEQCEVMPSVLVEPASMGTMLQAAPAPVPEYSDEDLGL